MLLHYGNDLLGRLDVDMDLDAREDACSAGGGCGGWGWGGGHAKEQGGSSINHEAGACLSLQQNSPASYFNCNIAEAIPEYWRGLLNQS